MSMFKKVKSLFDNKDQPPGSSPNGSETSTPSSSGAPKIWAIPPSVREQFAKGGAVRYNIKVVLRGARRVGKSSVMARLQGTFQNTKYAPSDEISAATIYYQLEGPPNVSEESYEVEAAKVDLWDVVDEGRAPPPPKGQPSGIPPRQPTDARSVDVYQNCHAAVFIVDVTRRDSWEYVVEEVKKVPSTCSICIALNFCDAPKPHAVTEREVVQLSNTLPRCCTSTVLTACQGQVPPTSISFGPTWVSLSALTGQGIDLLRSFLAVPVALERLQTLESRMKSIYSEIEVHQGMLLQRRAMEEFEAKEKQKSQSQTRENSVTAPPPDVEAKKPGPVVEKPRQVEPVKKQPEARSPSPKPQPPKEVVTAPQAVPVKQPTPSPAKKPSPPQAREEPTVAVKPAVVAPPQEKPAPVATPTPPQPTVATKKVVAASPASQRTPEEEKRLQEDFYGDITEEDEESIEESEEESDDEPILTPAARKAQLLQQQREQNATTAVVSSPVREAPVEPIPTRAAAKTDPPQGVAGSKTPTPGSSQERSEHFQELPTPPVEEVAPEEPAPTHKPTWQEDADKLANITVEDNVEGAAGAGKGLDAFLDDSEEEEEPQKPDEAIEEKSEVEEEVAEKEDSPSEEEPAPVPRGRQHRDPTRQRGNAPVTAATPEPSAAAAAPISDEVSEMLKQMADAMREEIKEGKKAKKSKKSKDDAEEGGEGTEKKKEKKPKSEKRHEGDGEKDKSDKKEKSKKEKKDKKKVDEE